MYSFTRHAPLSFMDIYSFQIIVYIIRNSWPQCHPGYQKCVSIFKVHQSPLILSDVNRDTITPFLILRWAILQYSSSNLLVTAVSLLSSDLTGILEVGGGGVLLVLPPSDKIMIHACQESVQSPEQFIGTTVVL